MRNFKFLGLAAALCLALASPVSADGVSGQGGVGNVKITGTVPLPAGAATSANQVTTQGKLDTINTSLGTLFQPGDNIGNTSFGASQSGTWNINNISGTVSLPSGAATAALQTTANTKLDSIDTTLGSPFQAGGSIGNTSFGATQSGTWTVQPGNTANTTAWKVTGAGGTFPVTGTFWQATQPISASSLPLPSGAATSALQTTGNSTLSTINTSIGSTNTAIGTSNTKLDTLNSSIGTVNTTLGSPFQAGGSIGNTAFGATQSGTWNINNVSGTISLPTGASTSSNQTAIQATAGSDASKAIAVQGITGGKAVPVSGTFWQTTQPVSGSVTVSGTVAATQSGTWNVGSITTLPSLPAGSNTIGKVEHVTSTSGGSTSHFAVMAATTNATNVKSSAGQLYNITVFNNSADIAYLKFYNKASAPTCNSDTVVAEYLIPGSASGAGASITLPQGKYFSSGISYCVTGGIAVTDNTAVAASAYIVNLDYK